MALEEESIQQNSLNDSIGAFVGLDSKLWSIRAVSAEDDQAI